VSSLFIASSSEALPNLSKFPPRARRIAIHETCDGHKNINNAGVVTLTGYPAKAFLHVKRAFTNKLFRRVEAKQPQIASGGLSDIWQVGELLHSRAINFVRVHDG
jgi:hypothetical protein